MKKSESKYFNTALLMNDALLLLLEKKEYDYITVKEICLKAGVNRSTFYLHYETMDDLLRETIECFYNRLKDKFKDLNISSNSIYTSSLDELNFCTPKYLVPYLEVLKENKRFFSVAFSHQYLFKTDLMFDSLYKDFFIHILERYNIEESAKKYYITFFMTGIHAIIIEWIKNDCKEDIDFICALIIKCVNSKQGLYEDKK